MNIYKLTFGGGQYEDRWDYSIIFSSFENAKQALYKQFFTKAGYEGRAWWTIKEGIIDTEDWTLLVGGSIVEDYDYDDRGYIIDSDEDTIILYTERKELRGKRLEPIHYRKDEYSPDKPTHREVDNWETVYTPIMKACIRRVGNEETVELESINEITLPE